MVVYKNCWACLTWTSKASGVNAQFFSFNWNPFLRLCSKAICWSVFTICTETRMVQDSVLILWRLRFLWSLHPYMLSWNSWTCIWSQKHGILVIETTWLPATTQNKVGLPSSLPSYRRKAWRRITMRSRFASMIRTNNSADKASRFPLSSLIKV